MILISSEMSDMNVIKIISTNKPKDPDYDSDSDWEPDYDNIDFENLKIYCGTSERNLKRVSSKEFQARGAPGFFYDVAETAQVLWGNRKISRKRINKIVVFKDGKTTFGYRRRPEFKKNWAQKSDKFLFFQIF